MRRSAKVLEQYPVTFETFRRPGLWEKRNLEQGHPSCFNGVVEIRRWRITIELVDEPNDVLAARLQELWDVCDTMHSWAPLKKAAKEVGYELRGSPGRKRSRS